MHSISLLIKPASWACNLHCTYCFYQRVHEIYPGERPYMNLETARTLIRKSLELGCDENVFCWQGGEPTLLGLDFFREVVRSQRACARPGQTIGNALQTNGLLLDRPWAAFLAEHRFLVGLSLDGPRDVHDPYRKSLSGGGSFDRVMQAAKRLKEEGAEFNILALVTDANVSQPGLLYDFFVDQGFTHLQFIPCVERNPMTGEPAPFSLSAEAFGRFQCGIFDRWMSNGFAKISIRFIEDILIYFVDGVHVSCNWAEACGSYLLVEHNGDVYPCDFFVRPEWKLGNIVADPYAEIFHSPLLRRFSRMKATFPQACETCRWLSFCHGDCTRLRADGRGGYGEASALCSARKMLLDHMEPHLETIREEALETRRRHSHAVEPGPSGKVGRNAPCPCGSGLKFKRCCGQQARTAQ